MKRFGFLDRAVGYLKEAGMEVELYLPRVIQFNAKNPEAAESYAEIAKAIDLKGNFSVTGFILHQPVGKRGKEAMCPVCF